MGVTIKIDKLAGYNNWRMAIDSHGWNETEFRNARAQIINYYDGQIDRLESEGDDDAVDDIRSMKLRSLEECKYIKVILKEGLIPESLVTCDLCHGKHKGEAIKRAVIRYYDQYNDKVDDGLFSVCEKCHKEYENRYAEDQKRYAEYKKRFPVIMKGDYDPIELRFNDRK